MKHFYYYSNISQQKFTCKGNDTFEQRLVDRTLTVTEYLPMNRIPVDDLSILLLSVISVTLSLLLSFLEFIDALDQWKKISLFDLNQLKLQ